MHVGDGSPVPPCHTPDRTRPAIPPRPSDRTRRGRPRACALPVAYITDLRLEYARNLISGGMSIEAAAVESGFNDPKYFARRVKKHFGCTPSKLKTYGK